MSVTLWPDNNGYLGKKPMNETPHVKMAPDGTFQKIEKLVVHTFSVGDVDDPDLYAAEPLLKWQHSDVGKWVMENAVETPMWHRTTDYTSYSIKYAITAKLWEKDYTYFLLKYT
jgi:hypothetical protein